MRRRAGRKRARARREGGPRLLSLVHLHHVDPPVSEVLREERVGDLVVLVRRVRVDVCARRSDRAELDHQREAVGRVGHASLLVVVERAVRTARAVVLPAPRADVPVRQVEPQVLLHARLGAHPVLRVGRDLAPGLHRQLHEVRRVARRLDVHLPRDGGVLLLRRARLVIDERVGRLDDQLGKLGAGQPKAHGRLGFARAEADERLLLHHVVLLLVRLEPTLNADGELRWCTVILVRWRLGDLAPLAVEVEARSVALAVQLHELCAEAEVALERHVQPFRRERRVERECALVVAHLVVRAGGADAGAHLRSDRIELGLARWHADVERAAVVG